MIYSEPFIHAVRPDQFGIKEFLEKTFEQFNKELARLRETIYGYDYDKPQYIFALNERTWLGVFNNAIIKAFPDATTLQEYGVYKEKEYVGRADFLVYWTDKNGKKFYLLFEAKQHPELSAKNLLIESEYDFDVVREQGMKYIKAEKNYYENKENVYVIPLFFGWMQGAEMIKMANEYFKPDYKKENVLSDFCYLYSEDNNGAWVYGKVYDAKKYINL